LKSLPELALWWRERGHFESFERACRNPLAAQNKVLQGLLADNANTAFGRDHDFEKIRDTTAWRARVPVRDYEALRPYMDRLVAGEERVLTRDAPCMFATTSGTTGLPKLIPVTAAWRRQMGALLRLWIFAAQQDHPGCLTGKVLTIVSPAVEGHTPRGIPFGAMSGMTAQKAPFLTRRQFAVPPIVSSIVDYETRYFLTMRLALMQPVSLIMTPNPTTLMRFRDITARHGESLVRAIHDGTLGVPWPELQAHAGHTSDAFKQIIQRSLAPDPACARRLAKAMERDGELRPRHAWPGLLLIGCWLGGSAGQHAKGLGKAFGEQVALRDMGLLASEGRMTIPLEDDHAAGPLYVHANYYEFIAEADIERPHPPILGAHELIDGGRYYLVLTGGNGLYRYDLNDVVEVNGFYHNTPKVAFVRKGRDMVSITGEKLHLNQIQAAVRAAERAADCTFWQYRVVPDVAQSRYDWLVELELATSDEADLQTARKAFDSALAELNMEYRSKRESGRLEAPRLLLMQPGWSERVAHGEISLGRRDVQYKWAHIQLEWDEASRQEVRRTLDDALPGADAGISA
jgi:hypothetical protein